MLAEKQTDEHPPAMKRARTALHFASLTYARLQTYDYYPAARWIDTRINSKVRSGLWGWLWIWQILLTVILTASLCDSVFYMLGATSDARYSHMHPVNLTESIPIECTAQNATFESCLRAFLAAEYATSYYPDGCAL
jgi:hypothetical protein